MQDPSRLAGVATAPDWAISNSSVGLATLNKHQSFIEMLDAWWGGGITTLFGAFVGRFMFHANEVRASRRKLLGKEVIWELPIAVGMAIIGESLASWMGFDQTVRVGLIAALAYLGPRGAEVMLMKYFPPTKP